MEQIADSINGLVCVSRQSQQTQQINILHQCRKELEDTIQSLDISCMELELRMLEENSGREKGVYRRMLKKEEVEQNRRELEKTTKLISNQESIAPMSTSTIVATPVAMPHLVNMDGNMSVDENGNTYNNNDTEEKSDD